MVPQGDIDENDKSSKQMAVKITKKVKYAMALYHKINSTRSKFYMESFMLFSKSAQLLDYATQLKQTLVQHLPGLLGQFLHLCPQQLETNLR